MSRDKFEAWFISVYGCPSIGKDEELFDAWLAGRESMRDESSNRLQEKHNELGLFHYLVAKEEVKKIEP